MKVMAVLFVFFVVIGVGCLALGVNDYIHQEAWFAQAVQAEGTITAFDLHVRSDGKSDFCPRIEFTTKVGEPATTYGGDCSTRPDENQIGQHVSFYYDPNNPSDTRNKGWLNEEGSGLIAGLVGFVFFPLVGSIGPVSTFLSSRFGRNRRVSAPLPSGWGSQSILEQDAQRYHANQRAAARAASDTEPLADAEAKLARLKQQEEELQRKIEERRRQQGQ